MYKKLFIILVININLFALNEEELLEVDNSFITKAEYGKMLYNNPRGIGCNSCHGADANGKRIVNFKHVYDKEIYNCKLIIPSIRDTNYDTFSRKINQKKNIKKKFEKEQVCEKLIYNSNVMPKYFLVEEEIEAIYKYIQSLKK